MADVKSFITEHIPKDIPGLPGITKVVNNIPSGIGIPTPGDFTAAIPKDFNVAAITSKFPDASALQAGFANLPNTQEVLSNVIQQADGSLSGLGNLSQTALSKISSFDGGTVDSIRESLLNSAEASGISSLAPDFRVPQLEGGRPGDPTFPSIMIGGKDPNSAATSPQERLFKVLPRSAKAIFSPEHLGKNSGWTTAGYNDRGPIASMRLLANPNVKDRPSISGIDIAKQIGELTSKTGQTGQFKDFFLTNVQVAYDEKVQVMTTFGDNFVAYYFGRQPVVFNLSGIVFDTLDQDWFNKFFILYQTTLRGTQLARNFELVEIYLPNLRLVGTINSLQNSQDSSNDSTVTFSMQFLAKLVEPIAMPAITGSASFGALSGSFLNFNVGKGGAKGSGFSAVLQNAGTGVTEVFSENSPLGSFGGIGTSVNEILKDVGSFNSSIFSPVYGIISSITKVVKSTTGDISGIISTFSAPVNTIIRDINNVTNQVAGVVSLVETSVNKAIQVPSRTFSNFNNSILSIKNTAGTILRVPETISQSLKRLKNMGRVSKGAAILGSNPHVAAKKIPLLNSGAPYTPQAPYRLN